MAREEGTAALFRGIVPGLHRQVLLGGVRIASCASLLPIDVARTADVLLLCCQPAMKRCAAVHGKALRHVPAPPLPPTDPRPADDPIRDFYGRLLKEEEGHTSLPTKIAAALTAGTLAVMVGNPTDGTGVGGRWCWWALALLGALVGGPSAEARGTKLRHRERRRLPHAQPSSPPLFSTPSTLPPPPPPPPLPPYPHAVLKVRMQAQGRLPAGAPQPYPSALAACE